MCSCILLWYLLFTICSLFSVSYRIIEYFFWKGTKLGDLATYLQIFALCFFSILSIQKYSEKEEDEEEIDEKKERLIKKKEPSILRDHCSKYLFSYAEGCLLISYCIMWIVDVIKGTAGKYNSIEYIDRIYSFIALPIGCVLDLFVTEKRRCPRPVIDLILLNCALTLFCGFEYGYQHRESLHEKSTINFGDFFKKEWISLVLRYIFSILAYFLYDYLVFIREKKKDQYYHFLSLDTSKPKEKPKPPKKEQKDKEESKVVDIKSDKTDIKSSDDKVV